MSPSGGPGGGTFVESAGPADDVAGALPVDWPAVSGADVLTAGAEPDVPALGLLGDFEPDEHAVAARSTAKPVEIREIERLVGGLVDKCILFPFETTLVTLTTDSDRAVVQCGSDDASSSVSKPRRRKNSTRIRSATADTTAAPSSVGST